MSVRISEALRNTLLLWGWSAMSGKGNGQRVLREAIDALIDRDAFNAETDQERLDAAAPTISHLARPASA